MQAGAGVDSLNDACWPVDLVGRSSGIIAAREQAERAAVTRGHVLISAEAGFTLIDIARRIHARAERAPDRFTEVDCATHDRNGLERELFGAATSSGDPPSQGLETVGEGSLLARGRGHTVFLPNVVELPTSVQARLARLFRDGEACLRGSSRTVPMKVRVIAGGDAGIAGDVTEGRFRQDLFNRLAAIWIDVPPLRDRGQDVPVIARWLAREICAATGAPVRPFTEAAMALMAALPWRGNTHELRTILEQLLTSDARARIQVEDVLARILLQPESVAPQPNATLREARCEFERRYIQTVLARHAWRIAESAESLGIQRTNLYRKIRDLGIPRPAPHYPERR